MLTGGGTGGGSWGVAAAGPSFFVVADVTVAGLGGCRVSDMTLSISDLAACRS